MKSFNELLRESRRQSGKTQKEIAKELGVVESCYANWEQGRTEPSISALKQICEILDVSSDYLIGIEK